MEDKSRDEIRDLVEAEIRVKFPDATDRQLEDMIEFSTDKAMEFQKKRREAFPKNMGITDFKGYNDEEREVFEFCKKRIATYSAGMAVPFGAARTRTFYFDRCRNPAAGNVCHLLFHDDFYPDGRNFHAG